MEEAALLCLFAFFAGMVDAVAGGGGLIQVPALFAVLPAVSPVVLLGTNKLASIAGTAVALVRYAKAVPIPWRTMARGLALAGAAAAAGAWAATELPPEVLRPVVIALLLMVAGYTLLNRGVGLSAAPQRAAQTKGETAYGTGFGFYDGFFGPGAGAFLMFGFVKWFRRSFLEAAARTKAVNLATNTGALAFFCASGNVDFAAGAPMALANLVGAYVGASVAVRRGAAFIRSVFVCVVIALLGKLIFDMLS
jgi:uncharacterized protein